MQHSPGRAAGEWVAWATGLIVAAVPATGSPALDLAGGPPFPALWLRDNCPCDRCVAPGTGQRLHSVTDLDPATAITAVAEDGDRVSVVFAPDGHRATFARSWLDAHRLDGAPAPDGRTEDAKRLWTATDRAGAPPAIRWPDFRDDPASRRQALEALIRWGFVRLREVPATDGAVLAVADGFGYVRRTNYGEVFDVRVEPSPANLAYSSLPIAPHTDNPYRDPVPTVQMLHCLVNEAEGGESGLVDGFRAAVALRAEDPAAFGVLTRALVTFRYADATADLTATRPLIGLDPAGRVREVRFNNRSMGPVRLSAGQVVGFYRAHRRFAELLYADEARLALRLEPGDALVFDNTRVLHARTGFAATGRRHLQGCYVDLDTVGSHLAVLGRVAAAAAPGGVGIR